MSRSAGTSRVLELDRVRVRERAVARFGAERMVDEYAALYQRVLSGGGVPGRD